MQRLLNIWRVLPFLTRAVVVGLIVLGFGQLPITVLVAINAMVMPAWPWVIPIAALYLWGYWQYLDGKGWPRSTSNSRRQSLGSNALTPRLWAWALLAGGSATVALRALTDIARVVSPRPGQDLVSAEALARYPFITVLGLLLLSGITAGIVEEAALRGYMQRGLERRYGRARAILVVGVVFALAHYRIGAPDARPWLVFVPAYLAGAVAWGLLASITDSIIPGIILHSAFDVIGFLRYWQLGIPHSLWETGPTRGFWIRCAIVLVFGIASVPAYIHLSKAARAAGDRSRA
ncbi:MAG: type II CAAX endopeptidase family protein [Acidobacteriota bacterium]